MKKIPTVFQRDPEDMRRVLPEVTPGCEWVLAGEGVATRKYDGTCCMFDGTSWWARREVKPGKPEPDGFVVADHDLATGKTVGWVHMADSSFARWHTEALADLVGFGQVIGRSVPPDTYEIVFLGEQCGYEGVVWHHPDGRMAKLKARDFPREEARNAA